MNRLRTLAGRLLHPPGWAVILVPMFAFPALICVFAAGWNDHALAYPIYVLSAYSLAILLAALPRWKRWLSAAVPSSRIVRKLASHKWIGRYWTDLAFRGSVRIYQGMIVNFLYVIFRVAAGIRYASVWFLSMAAYYLVLGGLRADLAVCRRRCGPEGARRCYRRTAWLLFLLNLPMGGMIALMIWTNSGFSYPGSVIYLSAMYTFYTVGASIANLVKYRKLGDPILSAAKVLDLIAAAMSVLGLQTAMIARFSAQDASFRRLMNALTGGGVYAIVIAAALVMLLRGRNPKKKVTAVEPL